MKGTINLRGSFDNGLVVFTYHCPGCRCWHEVPVKRQGEAAGNVWGFNDDLDRPSLSPSVVVTYDPEPPKDRPARCHHFITGGQIHFLSDSLHELAGQTRELTEIEFK